MLYFNFFYLNTEKLSSKKENLLLNLSEILEKKLFYKWSKLFCQVPKFPEKIFLYQICAEKSSCCSLYILFFSPFFLKKIQPTLFYFIFYLNTEKLSSKKENLLLNLSEI